MSLSPGARPGPYEVLESPGVGGGWARRSTAPETRGWGAFTPPHDALVAKLKSLTISRAVPSADSPTGWKIEADPFPG